ncbi:MAG TPA: autotransporter outer membrane beta-barrel domain-containing protein [Steroidobacteraceae bacterium]|nr:autotransporter outer membrane beta-barrel domain-containing protein [Steroidobacteraceae bacterium]
MKLSKWYGSTLLLAAMLLAPSVYAQKAGGPTTPISPNTLQADRYFQDICFSASASSSSSSIPNLGVSERRQVQAATPQGQSALRNACGAYLQAPTAAVQKFIEGINPTGFISFKIDSLLFAQSENDSAMDRAQALRRMGTSGANAYNISGVALGGGASADDSGSLTGKKLGLWFRLNSSSGTKDQTLLTDKLDSSQFGGNVGMDYRVGDNAVIGGILGYRHSSAKFGDGGVAGKLDASTLNLSGYFSSYLYKSLYLDSVINYGKVSYDTRRNVADLSVPPTVYSPDGSTDGNTLTGSVALGYEFAANGWTITPSVHYMYIDSKIDAFAESGTGPFDLSFDKQHYTSSSARLDLNVSYAVNSESAVWLPHVRVEAIREFGANIDTFDVRFVNDLGITPAPLTVQTDQLDDQYFRVSAGVSAQFRNDVSAYLDYQQLLSFDAVSLRSVVAGLRLQF